MFGPNPGSRIGPGNGIIKPYVGQVATRCFLPSATTNATTGFNCRTAHYMRDTVPWIQVGFPNFYIQYGVGETNASNGGTQTITGAIETASGTRYQMTFGGSTSITVQKDCIAWCDPIYGPWTNGSLFYTRRYQTNSVGIYFNDTNNPTPNLALGDALDNSNTDKTMSGTITDSGTGTTVTPCAIIGLTTRPSICDIGSSRSIGYGDYVVDSTGDTGYARFYGGNFAYMNFGIAGDTIGESLTISASKRFALARLYCTHLWLDPGLNDFNSNNSSAAQVEAWLTQVTQFWPQKNRVIINDEGPWTTSSNNWETTGGQTALSWEANRVLLNTWINALTGYNQIVKMDVLDRAGTSSTFAWKNNGTAFEYTPDGIHETTAQLLILKAANVFNPALITLTETLRP